MRAIVFVLRGCPAGWLGAYGNEWVGTPNLDRLAAEGVVFDRHVSDCPDPDAARRSWLTGRHQFPPIDSGRTPSVSEGVASITPSLTLGVRPEQPELLAQLKSAGVRTVIVRANHPDADGPPPYYAGWDEVFDARPRAEDDSPLDTLIRSLPSLLDRLGGVPRWLVWVETDRLVPPWDVPQDVFEAYLEDPEEDEEPEAETAVGAGDEFEDADEELGEGDEPEEEDAAEEVEEPDEEEVEAEDEAEPEEEPDEEGVAEEAEPEEPVTPFADPPTGPFDRSDFAAWEWLHRTFAAVVTTLDAELGRVFDELRPRGLDQTAAWLVTADLGWPLGEHGQVGPHRPWLHEEFVHLPLILRLPAATEAGRRVSALTQPADLAPTLLDLFGAEPPPGAFHGHSLLPLAHGRADTVRGYACSGLELNGAAEWAIRTDDGALLLPARPHPDDPPREPMLFEKPDDRWEVNDLRPRGVDRAEELEAVLRAFVAAAHRPGPLVVPEPPP